jgi:hypothetical protein
MSSLGGLFPDDTARIVKFDKFQSIFGHKKYLKEQNNNSEELHPGRRPEIG